MKICIGNPGLYCQILIDNIILQFSRKSFCSQNLWLSILWTRVSVRLRWVTTTPGPSGATSSTAMRSTSTRLSSSLRSPVLSRKTGRYFPATSATSPVRTDHGEEALPVSNSNVVVDNIQMEQINVDEEGRRIHLLQDGGRGDCHQQPLHASQDPS